MSTTASPSAGPTRTGHAGGTARSAKFFSVRNTPLNRLPKVFRSFLPYLRDARYLRRAGALVLLVHRADHLTEPRRFAETWRRLALEHGLGDLRLVASETHAMSPEELGFDALAEFPPVGDSDLGHRAYARLPVGAVGEFRGRMCSYPALAERYMTRAGSEFGPTPDSVVPRWDNTPRRLENATLYVGSSPRLYGEWLTHARETEQAIRGNDGLVFINAWNEWAEGAYLEPDDASGTAYLDVTRWGGSVGQRITMWTRGPPGGSTSRVSHEVRLALPRRWRNRCEDVSAGEHRPYGRRAGQFGGTPHLTSCARSVRSEPSTAA